MSLWLQCLCVVLLCGDLYPSESTAGINIWVIPNPIYASFSHGFALVETFFQLEDATHTVCKKSPHYFFSAFVSPRSINSEGGFKQSTVALIYLICKVHFKIMTFYLSYLKHKESAQIILTDKTEGPELGLAMRLHQNDAHIRKRCGCVRIENVNPH